MEASKPTICQLVHSLRVGGAEILVAQLARATSPRYRVVFACLDDLGTLGEELRQEGYHVEVLDRRSGLDWRCSFRLGRFLRRHNVDLVHAHQYTPFFYGITARLFYRRPAILFTEHGRHFPDYPRRKRMLFNRLMLRRWDRVVGVGHAVRQALIQNEGIPSHRVSVVYNGINLRRYSSIAGDRTAVRKELGLEPDDFVIVQVARMDYLKDHGTAIRTIAQIAPRCPQAKLVLVGEGPELEKVQEQVNQLDVSAHVRFVGLRKDVPSLLAAADLFLLTSISEGIPLTVIEAMAAGLPVVGTRVGGMEEVIEEGATGLLAAAGDDKGLANHILHLIGDPALRTRMGEKGRERAFSLFSQEQMLAGYMRLYQEQLEG
ncbi:MAG: glycosyltransferase [Gemmataceae bacterium]